jgi:hypothetical protein
VPMVHTCNPFHLGSWVWEDVLSSHPKQVVH